MGAQKEEKLFLALQQDNLIASHKNLLPDDDQDLLMTTLKLAKAGLSFRHNLMMRVGLDSLKKENGISSHEKLFQILKLNSPIFIDNNVKCSASEILKKRIEIQNLIRANAHLQDQNSVKDKVNDFCSRIEENLREFDSILNPKGIQTPTHELNKKAPDLSDPNLSSAKLSLNFKDFYDDFFLQKLIKGIDDLFIQEMGYATSFGSILFSEESFLMIEKVDGKWENLKKLLSEYTPEKIKERGVIEVKDKIDQEDEKEEKYFDYGYEDKSYQEGGKEEKYFDYEDEDSPQRPSKKSEIFSQLENEEQSPTKIGHEELFLETKKKSGSESETDSNPKDITGDDNIQDAFNMINNNPIDQIPLFHKEKKMGQAPDHKISSEGENKLQNIEMVKKALLQKPEDLLHANIITSSLYFEIKYRTTGDKFETKTENHGILDKNHHGYLTYAVNQEIQNKLDEKITDVFEKTSNQELKDLAKDSNKLNLGHSERALIGFLLIFFLRVSHKCDTSQKEKISAQYFLVSQKNF